MATVPTSIRISEDEYRRTTYEPECEFVDGALLPKQMPKKLHSKLQKLLLLQLAAQESTLGIEVFPELRIHVAPGHYRVPDLALYTEAPDGDVPTNPPFLTIEIVSDTEGWQELRAKIADHKRMGVKTVIIADPYRQEVFVAGSDGLLHQLKAPGMLDVILPNKQMLALDFSQLFGQL